MRPPEVNNLLPKERCAVLRLTPATVRQHALALASLELSQRVAARKTCVARRRPAGPVVRGVAVV